MGFFSHVLLPSLNIKIKSMVEDINSCLMEVIGQSSNKPGVRCCFHSDPLQTLVVIQTLLNLTDRNDRKHYV